jgi:hypothetical protein
MAFPRALGGVVAFWIWFTMNHFLRFSGFCGKGMLGRRSFTRRLPPPRFSNFLHRGFRCQKCQ